MSDRKDEIIETTTDAERTAAMPVVDHVDAERTEVLSLEEPVVVNDAPLGGTRNQTQVIQLEADDQPLVVRDRETELSERNHKLGVVSRAPETTIAPLVDTTTPVKRTTDRWHGSLALFLLRWVTAAIVGAHGVQRLLHLTATKDYFAHSLLPQPQYFAWGVTIAEIVIAVLLVLGLATRVAGLLLIAVETILLAFLIWGKGNPLTATGFLGELELLLATVGLLFLLLGGGGWAFDRSFRSKRAAKREARSLGQI